MGGEREFINGDNWETKSLKGQINVIELLGHDPKVKTINAGREDPSSSQRLVPDGDLGQEDHMADEQVLDLYKVNGSQCGPEPKMWEGSNETIIADHLGLGAKNGRGPYGNIVNPTKTWTNVLEEKVNSGIAGDALHDNVGCGQTDKRTIEIMGGFD
ncbi:hypothetical protein V6N12_000521 [Hibiscus sabdariffa]|uniref:Uncharacterized protein n=1 Tax=Hibiscus sabdariffa TaxID=183260 RepID=A0ABR2AVP4_9ROSI